MHTCEASLQWSLEDLQHLAFLDFCQICEFKVRLGSKRCLSEMGTTGKTVFPCLLW